MKYTLDQIRGMTNHQRHTLWKNARTRNAPELVRLIEECGLPYTENAALRMDDPITIRMFQIINSPEGKAAMLAATEKGCAGRRLRRA
jgi:hypothetical protein